MMHCSQQILNIGAGPHLLGGTQKHPHLPAADLGEQLLLFRLRVRMVDKGHLLRRDVSRQQLPSDIVIHIEAAVPLGRGQIAEDHLGQALPPPLLPYAQHTGDAGVELAARIVRQQRVHQPLVQPDLPSVRRDAEHIVLGGVHLTCVYPCRPLR